MAPVRVAVALRGAGVGVVRGVGFAAEKWVGVNDSHLWRQSSERLR
jgi:hypothetical protein